MEEAEDLEGHIKFLREANDYITKNVVTSSIVQAADKDISKYAIKDLNEPPSRAQSMQQSTPAAETPALMTQILSPETASVNQSVEELSPKPLLPEKVIQDEEKIKQQALEQKRKMFPKVPKDLVTLEMDKTELLRLSCAYELVQTEVDYVRDLSTMIHVSINYLY
jgi:hypothetical protein